MSAFYSFVYPDRVQLLTDGGAFDSNGVLRAIECKVTIATNVPVALTYRGDAATIDRITREIEERANAVAFFGSAGAVLDHIRQYFAALAAKGEKLDAEFLIAAFTEADGACHFFVQCHGQWDVPSFELLNLGAQIGGGPAIGLADLGSEAIDIDDPNFPKRHGVAIMEAMRRKLAKVPGSSREFHGVAGRCDLTTVTASGVTTQTLRTWPDRLNELVDPFAPIAINESEAA